jgi:AcrR family transcriptional regulator
MQSTSSGQFGWCNVSERPASVLAASSTPAGDAEPDPFLRTIGTPASERVKAAAVDLFANFGFLATTVRDITAACGLTSAAFYNHFESKEGLLYAVISETDAVIDGRLKALQLDGVDAAEALDAHVRVVVTFGVTYPKRMLVAYREFGFLHGESLATVVRNRRNVRTDVEKILSMDKRSFGLLGPDAPCATAATETRLLANAIMHLGVQAAEWYRPDGVYSASDVADIYCRLAARMANLTH